MKVFGLEIAITIYLTFYVLLSGLAQYLISLGSKSDYTCNRLMVRDFSIQIKQEEAQWLSGRLLDSRPKGRGFEPHRRHCVVVLGQDTFILA